MDYRGYGGMRGAAGEYSMEEVARDGAGARAAVTDDIMQAADSLAQIMNDTPRGTLKITAPVTFGSYSLMPLVTAFLRDNPDVNIDLHLTDRFVDLVEEGYEAAFRIGPPAITG